MDDTAAAAQQNRGKSDQITKAALIKLVSSASGPTAPGPVSPVLTPP